MNLLDHLTEAAARVLDKAARPGLLGAIGIRLEKKAERDLRSYFISLGRALAGLELEKIVDEHAKDTEELVRHVTEMRLANLLRRYRPLLLQVLTLHLQQAYIAQARMDIFAGENWVNRQRRKNDLPKIAEADRKDAAGNPIPPDSYQVPGFPTAGQYRSIDFLDAQSKMAAEWAARHSAALVTGIDATTQSQIADAIMAGIQQQKGVQGTGRLIRAAIKDMSVARAKMIARTELSQAMATSSIDKLHLTSTEYKQIILSDDACEICQDNADEDPLPVGEMYQSGDEHPPFHPNCRCAITGSRPPAGKEEEQP
jgi:hypothetical protein